LAKAVRAPIFTENENTMRITFTMAKACFALAAGAGLAGLGLLLAGLASFSGYLFTVGFIALALAFRPYEKLRGYSYTLVIFAAVTAAMYYPANFVEVNGFALKGLIVPLLQVIMFGMGTTMSLRDFSGVVQMPKAVLMGLVCQFTIMPLLGAGLANGLGFAPEVAAGIVLVGCSPSGLASNVMSYLAKANVALSITLTAVATLMAPLMTPLLMKMLAGQLVEVNLWAMVLDIVKIVIVPIVGGLIFNKLFYGKAKWLEQAMPLVSMGGIAAIITIITASGRDNLLQIGLLLILATFLHNVLGYVLGYWTCRLLRMDEKTCRTVAIEVGLQNAGLASGLALGMGKVATMGLAPAVFGPLMNITGSVLANWWSGKPPEAAKG
jgi:bile acid:Na+ symporter, BASS family